MGLHRCFVRLTRNTASITQWMYPFRAFATQGDEVQPAREFVSVEIRLLSGNHTIVRVVSPSPRLERCRAVTLFTQLTLHSYCGQQLAVAAVLCCAMLCCAVLRCAALYCQRLHSVTASHPLSWATKTPRICSPYVLSAVWCRNPAGSCAQCLTWLPVRLAHLQAVKLWWCQKPDAVPEV